MTGPPSETPAPKLQVARAAPIRIVVYLNNAKITTRSTDLPSLTSWRHMLYTQRIFAGNLSE